MDKTKSSAVSQSGGAAKIPQHPADSKVATADRRIEVQMVQNILLIWLDNSIDNNSADCRKTITQLRSVVNSINTFTDADQCVDFLTNIYNENVCIIVSGALCQTIVPLIHDVVQLHTIFVFCANKTEYEKWAKDWYKIKGMFTEIASMCEALELTAQQCEQNTIPFSLIATGADVSKKKLDQIEPSFMYTQILKEILLTIKFEQQHITEFITYCREQFVENDRELRNIKKFEEKYRDETPIWWYTYESFLYPMLNRALRLMDVDIIIKIGFFIVDLHRHIEQLHSQQLTGQNSNKSFTMYRGQGMSKIDFEQLSKTKGGLISFNNFLSTSKKHDVSLQFARRPLANQDMVGILFVMLIDPSKSTTPFASIAEASYYKDREDEVLFAMHTVFRIGDITPMGENHRLVQVELTLISDDDTDLRALTGRIREETCSNQGGWGRLCAVLLKMGQSDKAQQVYEILLKQATESEKAPIYHQLGCIKDNLGKYQEAITLYEKSMKIYEKILPPNDLVLANSYSNIGLVYNNMGEYSKACLYHEKTLDIRQKSLPQDHPHLAITYNNIGTTCYNMREYSKALSSFEKALEIQQQSLPPNHPNLGIAYSNIGMVYDNMGGYSKALLFYEKALEIKKQSLPPNHPSLATSYNNIGKTYAKTGDNQTALSYFKKALDIQQQALPPNHPDLSFSYNNIGAVYDNMGICSEARSFYERAIEIGQQSLPANHPHLQWYKKNLDRVNKKL